MPPPPEGHRRVEGIPGIELRRDVSVWGSYMWGYAAVGADIYTALGIITLAALGLAPLAFLAAGIVFVFQAEGGMRFLTVTGVQTCALPIPMERPARPRRAAGADRPSGSRPSPPRTRGATPSASARRARRSRRSSRISTPRTRRRRGR